jgi:hypothetical protein
MGRAGSIAYWAGAAVLMLFGFVAILSIGALFLLTGAAMIVVEPWRCRRDVLWPALVGVWSFATVYILLAPGTCTGTSLPLMRGISSAGQVGRTMCTNVLGIDYSGGGLYSPPLMPAFVAGLVAAAVVGLALRRVLRPPGTTVRT